MITTTVISTTTSLSTRKAAQRGQQEELRMTSLDIAELCGKQHRHVMRDIRNMEPAWEKVNGSKFGLIEYTDLRGRLKPCYTLTKTECLYIATKYDDEMRAKLVLRWEELERERLGDRQQLALPSPQKITLTATQVAKTFNMTTLDFNAVLRDMGIQYRRHGRWNISDDLQGRGYTADRIHVSYSLKGEKKIKTCMTWTMAGLHYLNAKLGYPARHQQRNAPRL